MANPPYAGSVPVKLPAVKPFNALALRRGALFAVAWSGLILIKPLPCAGYTGKVL
ncbi:MAG: hypothetical protein HY699_20765 [Deltaproteobacteria bacterium]|nr:hypothetical protein [Deltaproteobacteria bacterium]